MGLVVNDIVQMTYVGSCFGQLIEMVRNYVVLTGFPPGNSVQEDLQLMNNAVSVGGVNDIETPYLACLPGQYSLFQIKSQQIKPTRSAYAPLNFVGGTPGTHVSPATSANRAAAITMRTAKAGRTQRGTVHVGPIPDAASLLGSLTAPYLVLTNALAIKLLLSFSPNTTVALVSPIALHADGTFDLWNSIIPQTTTRVQRRRTLGVGK